MATLTVKNSTYSSTSTSITITFTTDVAPTAVKLTKDGTNWISASSYTSSSATFNVSSWGKGTFTNCQLKVSYVEESSGGDTPGSSLTISNITGGTFTISNNATITYTTSAAVTKHEFIMNYTGSDSGFTDGTARVASDRNNQPGYGSRGVASHKVHTILLASQANAGIEFGNMLHGKALRDA